MKKACVVLPTYNEADNVEKVISGIFRQAHKITTHHLHVLVVDDNSPDGTQIIIKKLIKKFNKLHLITGEKNGLGEAYKRGMQYACDNLSPDLIFEMDADGQHDPEMIPLFVQMANFGFSLIIGSRFAPGGETPDFTLKRKVISLLGNWLIRVMGGIPRIRDCTSGYRCIKAELIPKCNFKFLSTRGYSFQSSLLCELLRNNAKVIEIPIIFPDRTKGKSKLSFYDQVEFLLNIGKIRFRQSEEFVKFCAVGISGVAINLTIYLFLTRFVGVHLAVAAPIAIESSILTNFFFNQIWTFNKREVNSSLFNKLAKFHTVAGVAACLNYFFFLMAVFTFKLNDILANIIGISIAMFVNYSLNSLWTWSKIKTDVK